MRLPRLNNRLVAREYMDAFERRFAQDAVGTLFLEEDGGAVRLTDEKAAHLIAAMRASLWEADAATPLAGRNAGFAMAGAAGGAVLLGAGVGLPGLGCALALPAAAAVFLMGPGLGAFRVDAAWARGLERARLAMADGERVAAADRQAAVPANRVRPALNLIALLTAAVVLGLIAAYVTMPFYGRVMMDRALSRTAPPVILLVVVLAFVARAVDATRRQPVSQAAIADALRERRRRPFR